MTPANPSDGPPVEDHVQYRYKPIHQAHTLFSQCKIILARNHENGTFDLRVTWVCALVRGCSLTSANRTPPHFTLYVLMLRALQQVLPKLQEKSVLGVQERHES